MGRLRFASSPSLLRSQVVLFSERICATVCGKSVDRGAIGVRLCCSIVHLDAEG